MEKNFSKGNWSIGRPGTVVTSCGDGFPGGDGRDDLRYYGGYLIAESILKKPDAQLIAAAPDLLESCLTAKAMYEAQGINERSIIGGAQYSQLLQAINKAIGQ